MEIKKIDLDELVIVEESSDNAWGIICGFGCSGATCGFWCGGSWCF